MQLTRIQKFGIAGGCMFFFSILLKTAIIPAAVVSQTRTKVALKEGWLMRGIWSKFPFAVEMQFYIFNVTNPDEIKEGVKPKLQQVGPFIYDKWHEKTNQVDNEEDDTVTFTVRDTYFFNQEKSGHLTGEEELTVPIYLALGLLNTIKREKPTSMPIAGKAIDSIFKKPPSLFAKYKVKDIIFDGLPIDCTVKDFAGSAVCSEIRANYEELGLKRVEEDQYLFSFFGTRNATDSKNVLRVNRGLKKLMNLGQVSEQNGKTNMSVWDDDYCDTFNGTDGTVFHPFFDKKGADDLTVYNADLCRNIRCYYDSKSKTAGLKTLRYTTNLGTDGNTNEHDKCFCQAPDKCMKAGAYDAFKCVKSPVVVTNPHFYLADPSYLEMMDGLKPVKEDHMVMIDLDAFTGIPLRAHTRAQFNMMLMKVDKWKPMKTFPEGLLPLFWFDEYIVLPDFLIKIVKAGHRMYTMGKIFQYFMMFGGMGLGGYAVFLFYMAKKQENNLNGKKAVGPKNATESNVDEKKMNISTIGASQIPATVE